MSEHRTGNVRGRWLRKSLLSLAGAVACAAMAFSASARTVRVVDGDTIVVEGTTYRLHGIDAPEAGQRCDTSGSGTWSCGKEAIGALEELVLGRKVVCDNRGEDDYDRVIAVCRADGRNVNAAMVGIGMAWAFRRFSEDYVAVEEAAQAAGVGVWRAPTQTPWDYRAQRWEVAAQEAPEGCPIKGNISRNGRIYHAPWSPWYTRTKLSVDKGERWFCTEAEALEAGWRAPLWGR